MSDEKLFQRFSLESRAQHIILLTSFLLLVVTGFALRYAHTSWARSIVDMLGGWEMRAHIHHVSGLVLVGVGIYHFIEYFVSNRKVKQIIPRFKDVSDFWGYVKYNLGAGDYPKYEKFEWKQKFEYWGVVWGTIVMGITGMILLFPFVAMKYIPYAWISIAGTMHFYEALLATLVVFIWHFYNVHLNFEFPLQTSFVTGKVTEEFMKKEHRIEYERTVKEEKVVEGGE